LTPAVTWTRFSLWQGPPIKFEVGIDQFYPVITATPYTPGTGYKVGDIITLTAGPVSKPPIGAPAQLLVTDITGPSGVAAVDVISVVNEDDPPFGGSYFAVQADFIGQGSTTGSGTGAVFNVGFGPQGNQRVILCNQEFAVMAYIRRITDPNVMDDLFLDAWATVLGARLCMALTGDKALGNVKIQEANAYIVEARKADANEGLTVNDVIPDWLRVRGIGSPNYAYGVTTQFDWGALWQPF
jgi:hypothetical protein